MRLISCYIENYGKIKQKTYDFSSGVTVLCEENGAGKSTLASFIKAMFYGLESYRANAKEFCDRQHFYPFEGGLFGGNLTFEKDGKRYRIERFFGEKSETADTLRVYCDDVSTDELGEDVGKSVFGIDKASFERTAFIGSDEIEIASTSSINAKLNNFLQGADEESNLDTALKKLEEKSKEYKKAKAGKDKISEETARIAALKEKIVNAEAVRGALEGKTETYARLSKEIENIEATVEKAQTQNEALGTWEHYEDLLGNVKRTREKLAFLRQKYPFGVPTLQEAADVSERLQRDGELKAQGEKKVFSDIDGARLTQLSLLFERGVPSEDALSGAEASIKRLAGLEKEIDLSENRAATDEEKRLVAKFNAYLPTENDLKGLDNALAEYKRSEEEYHKIPATVTVVENKKSEKKKNNKAYGAVAVFAAVLAVAGAALLVVNKALGIAALLVGCAVLFADCFFYLNGKTVGAAAAVTTERDNPAKWEKERELQAFADKLKATLLPLGYNSEAGLAFDVASLKKDVQTYKNFAEAEAKRKKRILENKEEKRLAEERLAVFFKTYRAAGESYAKSLADLRGWIREYETLKTRKEHADKGDEELARKIRENRKGVDAFADKYKIELRMQSVLSDINEIASLERTLAEAQSKAEAYKYGKALTEKPNVERIDISALNVMLSEKRAEQSRLARDIDDDERTVEQADVYVSELEAAEERLSVYKQKYKLLTAAALLLKQAEQNLKDKYVKPIKDEFLRYSTVIEQALGEKVVMNKNFEIGFERHGKTRSERHLSAGQRSICALCFRLALLKNMYAKQKPFLILDDPFVFLDKAHMKKVQSVLRALSADMQIVYFTCHESRMV